MRQSRQRELADTAQPNTFIHLFQKIEQFVSCHWLGRSDNI